jgi:hypothetical protein
VFRKIGKILLRLGFRDFYNVGLDSTTSGLQAAGFL